jgi:dihydroorotase/N-acyl-D-amino-acid deacylase
MHTPRVGIAILATALALSACATPRAAVPRPAAVYDVLIRGGYVVDGTGSPWFRGDVAISGDRIAAVGQLAGAQARDTIEARGLVVAPGFIDMLGHSEYPLLADGRAISKITQGITSEITGEVSSVVPVAPGSNRRWSDLDGYFAALEAMKRHVAEAMRQGAMGPATGLIYAPASFASTEELVELATVAAQYGGGYATHMRSEGDKLIEAIEEAIAIGERAGGWVQIHHLKASGRQNWGKMEQAVATIEAARARGIDVTADQYPYPAAGTSLTAILPNWAHAGGTDSLLARLADPETRVRLRAEVASEHGGGADWRISAVGGPEGVQIAGVRADSLKRYEGRRLSKVAEARGQEPVDALFDVLLADQARSSAVYFAMSEDDLEYALRQPWVSIGLDAGARAADSTVTGKPHPRAYGSFPRILCRYVREQGVLTLPDAVRKFTALPAARVGLDERGVIKAGLYADLTLFDPNTVCDRATFEEPVQTSVGIQHVLVNGVPVVRDGAATGARPGRALRRR